jgi:hypothetical protein
MTRNKMFKIHEVQKKAFQETSAMKDAKRRPPQAALLRGGTKHLQHDAISRRLISRTPR